MSNRRRYGTWVRAIISDEDIKEKLRKDMIAYGIPFDKITIIETKIARVESSPEGGDAFTAIKVIYEPD